MTDWQTSLMQQVPDPGLMDAMNGSFRPELCIPPASSEAQFARRYAVFAPLPSERPPTLVNYVGHSPRHDGDDVTVQDLVDLLLRRQSREPVTAFLDALTQRGLAAEHIYLRVLQPTARRLGELWLDDTCTFVDVTLAMTALHGGMRHLGPHFHRHGRSPGAMRSIVLATLDSEQHTFGLSMAAEFFRRSGWTVALSSPGDEMALRLRRERNAVVGFSVSRADQLGELAAAIRQVRRLGRDRVAGVLVGGPLFVARPDLVRETGADAAGLDARLAVAEAETLAAALECG